jgi:uncharacterized membrane protein
MWNAVLTLHLLAMAFFVGGQLFIAAAVLPVERRAPDRVRMRAVARNFGYGSLVALLILSRRAPRWPRTSICGRARRCTRSWG